MGPRVSLSGPLKSHLRPPISVSLSVTMMKYFDKNKLGGEGLIVAQSSRHSSSYISKTWSPRLTFAVKGRESTDAHMTAGAQLTAESRAQPRKRCHPPTVWSSPLQPNQQRKIPQGHVGRPTRSREFLRLPSQVISDCIKLTTQTNDCTVCGLRLVVLCVTLGRHACHAKDARGASMA